jgi:hypothetical protein
MLQRLILTIAGALFWAWRGLASLWRRMRRS